MAKASLEEMATAVQDEADRYWVTGSFYRKHFPDLPPDERIDRKLFVLERAAELLRLMGTFEDQSRMFIVGLKKEHAA